jgi:hypothetical protein
MVKKLIASDGGEDERFGVSVEANFSGNLAIIGSAKGAVYIKDIRISGKDYGETDYERATDKLSDSYGVVLKSCDSVAIDSGTAIVGAGGAAYIFIQKDVSASRLEGKWVMVKKLTAPNAKSYAGFGSSVSIYGKTVIVGATIENGDNKNNGLGRAYIFGRDQGGKDNWGMVKALTASDGKMEGLFGHSVAIDSDTAIVGAMGGNEGQGSVYIFERDNGGADNWGMVMNLSASDGSPKDRFGGPVAIYGGNIVVGVGGYDIEGNVDQGAVYNFLFTGSESD